MTPGRRDPRPTPWGPLSVLWWPVVLGVLWPLAGLSLLVWPADRRLPGHGGASGGRSPQNPGKGSFRARSARLGLLAAVLPLAACHDPDFRGSMGGPPMTAATTPPVVVDNPFWCPRTSQ